MRKDKKMSSENEQRRQKEIDRQTEGAMNLFEKRQRFLEKVENIRQRLVKGEKLRAAEKRGVAYEMAVERIEREAKR
jgi:hypothetical protein